MNRRTRSAATLVRALLGLVRVGTLRIVDGPRTHSFGSGEPHAEVIVRSPEFWTALLRGSRGLAEAYAAEWFDSPDIVAVIRLAARNAERIDGVRRAIAPVRVPYQRLRATLRPVTRDRSRKDIAAHYDLGNELFARMLDPTMSYSCAYFRDPGMSLEDAQYAKLQRLCDKLELTPADHLLEIGTGWGGLAIHAASTTGCRVTTTTISREQHEYAVEKVRRAGLQDRVNVLLEDYRDLRGRYDKLVSVEMIEAVGWQHFGRFLGTCSGLLKDDGLMALQAITIDDRAYEVEKASRSFIKEYIFPGGSLPSLEVLSRAMSRSTDMQVVWLEDITSHYVETLSRWSESFSASAAELEVRGYDMRFRRLWSLYLAYCEAGFAERRICDVQLLAAKPGYRSDLGPGALDAGGELEVVGR